MMFNKWLIIAVCLTFVFIIISNVIIVKSTRQLIFNGINKVPQKKVALLLGTSRYTSSGHTNLFFKHRIDAAVNLYKSGKVKHIIVSGDNSLKSYNEPREMFKALLNAGVPKNAITLDFAGFRTLDSVVRCKAIFGQDEVIIISQRFHLERALFIAKKYKMDAVGFTAEDPPERYSFKTNFREYFAKTKAVIDLYIINKKPKFLGKGEKLDIKN